SAWCEEWWLETIYNSTKFKEDGEQADEPSNTRSNGDESKIVKSLKTPEDHNNLSAEDAFAISKYYDVPLHPKFTYFYHDISLSDLNNIYSWISKFKDDFNNKSPNDIIELDLSPEKRVLEILGVPHTLEDGKVNISYDDYYTLIHCIKGPFSEEDGDIENCENNEKFVSEKFVSNYIIRTLNKASDVKIIAKSPTYIGTRVGRPEKSKERLMKPAPHVLFPIGTAGGSRRLIADAAKSGPLQIEIARRKCTECHLNSFQSICPHCGAPTIIGPPGRKKINVSKFLKKASENVEYRRLDEIKGVVGMISESKIPEPLEKGILRAKNDVFVFKDATIRHDSTDLPLTHFIPSEIGVSIEKLKEMGYEKDAYGEAIINEDQVVELKVQDVVISQNCATYLMGVANFIDDLLDKFYGMDRFYYVRQKEDLIGHLIAGLAPHTSAGVLGRIVGFTNALACYAHPFFHSAKRRNCDSDEDSVMLLLDALLNFSKSYLPSTRGGSMDAPLVLSSRIDPEEIDDESHNIDAMVKFPLQFFEMCEDPLKPQDVLDLVDNVSMRLGTPEQYEGLMFSHNTANIHAGPNICLYKTLPSMKEKVESQIGLAEKIRAVDQKGVVEGVLSSHFLPDIMGNVRAFSKQKVRCTKCNSKYRRIPLSGKCRCGSNLILSVSKGSVSKYLEISRELAGRYPINPYLKQRLDILEFGINSLFESDKSKQSSLDAFL
ncbi:MAG: DNA polymerase II large subunit, partial [Methanobacteriaceae archaeon]